MKIPSVDPSSEFCTEPTSGKSVDWVAPITYTLPSASSAMPADGASVLGLPLSMSLPDPPRYVEKFTTGSIVSVRLRSYSPSRKLTS